MTYNCNYTYICIHRSNKAVTRSEYRANIKHLQTRFSETRIMVQLKKNLEHGDIGIIAQNTGYHRDTVSEAVNGDASKYPKIVKEALRIIKARKREKQKLENQLKEIISES